MTKLIRFETDRMVLAETHRVADTDSLANLAALINAAHEAASAALKNSITHAMHAGELLIEAKDKLDHGEWLPWLKANFPFSDPQPGATCRSPAGGPRSRPNWPPSPI